MSQTKLNNSTDIGGLGSDLERLEKGSTSEKKHILASIRSEAKINFNKKLDSLLHSKGATEHDKKNADKLRIQVEEKIDKLFKKAIEFFINNPNSKVNGEVKTVNGQKINPYVGLFALSTLRKGVLAKFLDVRNPTLSKPLSYVKNIYYETIGGDGKHAIDSQIAREVAIKDIMQDIQREHSTGFKQERPLK